jgi:putative ABC transport system permease protein
VNKLRTFWRRLGSLVKSRALKQEIDEELRFHLEQRTAENIAAGMSPEAAAQAARRRFGNLQSVREACGEHRGLAWLENFGQDLRFGCRMLRKQPGSLVAAIAALTLGIGLVTVTFCAINSLVFQSLPLPQPDRVVSTTVPAWAFPEFSRQQTTIENLASFGDFHANFRAAGAPSRREVCFITANFLEVFRVKPLLGRGFLPDEAAPGAEPVAILSHRLWLEEFQGDRKVLGSTIWISGQPKTVVGVMPAEFRFPINDDLWVASEVPPELAHRDTGFVFGRLKPGVAIASAQAELNTIWLRVALPRRTNDPALQPIRVGAYMDALSGALEGRSDMALGTVAMLLAALCVLFLACANVAMLTLGRALKRSREFAVRAALGATRKRVILQLLVENLILSAAGGIGGILAAGYFMHWLMAQMPADTTNFRNYPSWWRFEIDGQVLFAVICLTFVTNLLAGLWPALQATKRDVNELLQGRALGNPMLGVAGFQKFLVTSQVAVSVVILVGALALLRQRQQLADTHLPFDPKTMLSVNVEHSGPGDPFRFFEDLNRNLARLPGVEAVALANAGFAFWHSVMPIEIEGKAYPRPEDVPRVPHRVVTSDYFNAVNLSLAQGRFFGTEDRADSLPVVIVNTTFAKELLSTDTPLGRRFRPGPDRPWLTVVGCVPDALTYGSNRREPVFYLPFSQHPRTAMKVLLRTSGQSPMAWTKTVAAEVARLQPDLPITSAATVKQELDGVSGGWMEAATLGACAAVSLFLAAVGIFGLITLSANQRTREIGIRLALGAQRSNVTMTILKQALPQISVGLVVGLLLALGVVRGLASVLPSSAMDPWVYLGVVILLGTVSVIAVLIPAWRGSKVDPLVALRCE